MKSSSQSFFAVFLFANFVSACSSQDHYLIASTGTVIGVEVSQNQATQAPAATLGYKRAELALVPTNRPVCLEKDSTPMCAGGSGAGASDTGEVVMELRYGGVFSLGSDSVIYQRLAVGDLAVDTPGAALMFARGNDGSVDPASAQAVADAANANVVALERRAKETYSKPRQQRISAILDSIDNLDDSDAIALEKNPALPNVDADKVVAATDPSNQRGSNGDAARKALKTRVIYIGRDETSLTAWESAVGAAN